MNTFYKVGDLIKVHGKILSPRFADNPPPASIAFKIEAESIVLKGEVAKVSEDGQVIKFKVIFSSADSSIVGSVIDVGIFEDLQIEHLTNYKVGDLINVHGKILSPRFADNPPPASIAFKIDAGSIVLKGEVVKVSEDGQVIKFKVIFSSADSSIVGSVIDVGIFEDLQIEHLTNF